MNSKLLKKIIEKKEFSQLPKKDVELAFEKFDSKSELSDYQKLKLTRNFLRKIYSSFSSRKLLSDVKGKEVEWFLNKHKSTKERLPFYKEIYEKFFSGFHGEISVIDLGAGINGLSYNFFPRNLKIKYIGVEAVGQLVDLMNKYFLKNKINGKAIHESLFELEKIKKIIEEQKKPKIIFLFKVVDSLEIMERNYSKKLLKEIVGLADRVVISFATQSLGRRSRFSARRIWLINFVNENFKTINDFELNGERYLVIEEK